jgi:hypothetical protein
MSRISQSWCRRNESTPSPVSQVSKPYFCNLTFSKNTRVDKVVTRGGSPLFRRRLWGDLAVERDKPIIDHTLLRAGDDRFTWSIGQKGFTVKTL